LKTPGEGKKKKKKRDCFLLLPRGKEEDFTCWMKEAGGTGCYEQAEREGGVETVYGNTDPKGKTTPVVACEASFNENFAKGKDDVI